MVSVSRSVCLSVIPAVSGVRRADEQQKLFSVQRTLYIFNIERQDNHHPIEIRRETKKESSTSTYDRAEATNGWR